MVAILWDKGINKNLNEDSFCKEYDINRCTYLLFFLSISTNDRSFMRVAISS